jgi:hypothetical protein
MDKKGFSKTGANRALRIITGRKNGTGHTLRAPLDEVEAYVRAGCPKTWTMKKRGPRR